jgi:hypothetical protein
MYRVAWEFIFSLDRDLAHSYGLWGNGKIQRQGGQRLTINAFNRIPVFFEYHFALEL